MELQSVMKVKVSEIAEVSIVYCRIGKLQTSQIHLIAHFGE